MSYWNRKASTSSPILDAVSLSSRQGKKTSIVDEFYEIEPGIVLDIILDKTHSYFTSKSFKLNADQWPVDVNGKAPSKTDPDYTWIGRALIRLVYSQSNVEKENLIWAMPLESNISEFPLLNETVGIIFYMGQYYYTRKINTFNTVNADADFNNEINSGGFRSNPNGLIQGNRELILNTNDPAIPYVGPQSKLNLLGSVGYNGVLGRYFLYNNRIRSLKHREGDLIFESRFGQSIRFAAYDDNRNNDKGYNSSFAGYTDYKGTGILNPFSKLESGGGNPMLIIRNRQRQLDKTNPDEKNVGGYMLEDINNDGSSIHLTSGVTISQFRPTCLKKMWGVGEEQSNFNGNTTFKYPQLVSDQMVLNSDRIIISAKNSEMFQYSKKRMAIVTDDEFTLDAQNQIVITTNNKTVLNSPAIYLGEYDQTNEPVLLGQTTVNWLYDLCEWLKIHTHWYKHTHPHAGQAVPPSSQTSVEVAALTIIQSDLNKLMSRRVFVTGGGLAPGANGGSITNGATPISIDVNSGAGVPGGWNGSNRKYSASEKQQSKNEVVDAQSAANAALTNALTAHASAEAAEAAVKTISLLHHKVSNSVTNNALHTAKQQAKLAKTNAKLANQYAQIAVSASNATTNTDNEIVRIQKDSETNDAADKAKYYAGLADTQNKSAQASLSIAQAEVSKVTTQKAANAASSGTKNPNGTTKF